MEEELEGVIIDNPEAEGIEIPQVDLEEEEIQDEDTGSNEDNSVIEDAGTSEIESLKRALNAERKQRKELQKQLKNASKAEKVKSTYDTLVEKGVDEELAKTLAEAIDKPDDRVSKLQFDNDLIRVSKNPEFADIEDYADEIKSLVDKGISIEQSYYAVTGGRKKEINTKSEIKRELEAKMRNQKQKAEILDIDTSSDVVDTKANKLKYSLTELAIAKAAGMTIEEYKAIQGLSSTRDYEKYKQSKAK